MATEYDNSLVMEPYLRNEMDQTVQWLYERNKDYLFPSDVLLSRYMDKDEMPLFDAGERQGEGLSGWLTFYTTDLVYIIRPLGFVGDYVSPHRTGWGVDVYWRYPHIRPRDTGWGSIRELENGELYAFVVGEIRSNEAYSGSLVREAKKIRNEVERLDLMQKNWREPSQQLRI